MITASEVSKKPSGTGVRPSTRHMMALQRVADSLGLGYLFTD